MHKTLTLAFVLLFASLDGRAQSAGLLTGRVASADGKALAGISLRLEETSFNAMSDAEGHFTIGDLPPGKYAVVISGGGFVPQNTRLKSRPGRGRRRMYASKRSRLPLMWSKA